MRGLQEIVGIFFGAGKKSDSEVRVFTSGLELVNIGVVLKLRAFNSVFKKKFGGRKKFLPSTKFFWPLTFFSFKKNTEDPPQRPPINDPPPTEIDARSLPPPYYFKKEIRGVVEGGGILQKWSLGHFGPKAMDSLHDASGSATTLFKRWPKNIIAPQSGS